VLPRFGVVDLFNEEVVAVWKYCEREIARRKVRREEIKESLRRMKGLMNVYSISL
jgi:hypothetical protein